VLKIKLENKISIMSFGEPKILYDEIFLYICKQRRWVSFGKIKESRWGSLGK